MPLCGCADLRSGKMQRNTANVMGKMRMWQCGYATNDHIDTLKPKPNMSTFSGFDDFGAYLVSVLSSIGKYRICSRNLLENAVKSFFPILNMLDAVLSVCVRNEYDNYSVNAYDVIIQKCNL